MADDKKVGLEFYYDAFISYRHEELDMKVALKLRRTLEGYHIPKSIAKLAGIKKINRLFRDREELPTSSNLSADIKRALEQSRFLIVVCSPKTPESKWCCQEIEEFKALHGNERILSILIEGEPDESFPELLRYCEETVNNPDGSISTVKREVEPLAADIRGKNQREMWKKLRVERLRLLAPMIGVKFDDLKQRHREQFIKNVAGIAFAISMFFAAFGIVASIQSSMISSQSIKLVQQSKELEQKNSELKVQINEKEKQRLLADKNGKEALKQADIALTNQKAADVNAAAAQANAVIAKNNEVEAIKQKGIAENNAVEAQTQRDKALNNESKVLSAMSRQETDNGNRLTGIKLALEALPGNVRLPDRPFVNDAVSSLYYSLYNKPFQGRFLINVHTGLVNDAVYSKDGSLLVTVSNDSSIRVWDTSSGDERLVIDTLGSQILTAAISPDNLYLATIGYGDNNTKIWDMKTGKKLRELENVSANASNGYSNAQYFYPGGNSIEFSGDGSKLIVSNSNMGAFVYETKSWKSIMSLTQEEGYNGEYRAITDFVHKELLTYSIKKNDFMVNSISNGEKIAYSTVNGLITNAGFSADGRFIAVSSDDGNVYLFDIADLKHVNILKQHKSKVNGVVFDKQIKYLLSYSEDSSACIWDYKKGVALHVLEGNYGPAIYGDFSPDGRLAVTAYEGNKAVVWDCATGKELAVLDKHRNAVFKAAFSPDGKTLTTVSYDNTVRVWDVYSGLEYMTLSGHTEPVYGASFSPDGKRVSTASTDNTVRVWDSKSGKLVYKISEKDALFFNTRFSRDGKLLMASDIGAKGKEGGVDVYNASDGSKVSALSMLFSRLYSNDFSLMHNKVLLYTFWDKTSATWDMAGKSGFENIFGNFIETSLFSQPIKQVCTITSGSFSADGKEYVSITRSDIKGFEIRVWDLVKGNMSVKLKLNQQTGYEAEYAYFNPDDTRIVTVSFGLGVNVWDAHTGEKIMKLPDQNSQYTFAAFSPDGKQIATAEMDGSICLWDSESYRLITRLTGHKETVSRLEFSPDGKSIVTASNDQTAIIWRIFPDTQDMIDYTQGLLQ